MNVAGFVSAVAFVGMCAVLFWLLMRAVERDIERRERQDR